MPSAVSRDINAECSFYMDTFIEKCLRGDESPEDIDDYVDQWHEGAFDQPLHTFLGMTPQEYSAWLTRPDTLSTILNARRSVRT